MQWHYLTLSQLSYVYQLMGDQLKSLEYLDKISGIYQLDVESSQVGCHKTYSKSTENSSQFRKQ